MNLKLSFLQRLDEIVHGHEANGIAVIATLTFESTSSFFTFEVSLLIQHQMPRKYAVVSMFYKCPCDGTNLIYGATYFLGPAILGMILGIMSHGFKYMQHIICLILGISLNC